MSIVITLVHTVKYYSRYDFVNLMTQVLFKPIPMILTFNFVNSLNPYIL